MRTPIEYSRNCKSGIITKAMLSDCLYSVNKRAKNYREQERKYRKMRYDTYHNEEKNREQKEIMYGYKENLLAIATPTCIHEEIYLRRRRIYENEPEYQECLDSNRFVYQGSYTDFDGRDTFDVYFGDVKEQAKRYYLFYDFGNHSFHTPIDEIGDRKLPIITIKHFETFGHDIDDLLSMQFVRKVLTLVESGEYTYVE